MVKCSYFLDYKKLLFFKWTGPEWAPLGKAVLQTRMKQTYLMTCDCSWSHRMWCVSRVNMYILWWICDDARWPCGFDAQGSACLRQSAFPRSPKDCFTPLECERNIFSGSLFGFAFRMHNPCLNMPRTTTPPCVIWVGVRDTCIPVGGIVELQRTWLEHYPSTRGSPCRYLLSPPTSTTHLLYQFTAVIYIIQTTGGCLWAPNHLLAFIS